jgi:hypothetical protein
MCVSLDGLLDISPPPAVVKIDVEGAEVSVLRGAQRLLEQIRPRILCEVSSGNREEASSILKSAGYRLYDAEARDDFSTEIAQCAWNTVALPGES